MDAPLYPPAAIYVQPKRLTDRLSTRETPIAQLKQNAAAWAIVLREIPTMERRISNPALVIHLDNFSMESLLTFRIVDRATLERIDAQLLAMETAK